MNSVADDVRKFTSRLPRRSEPPYVGCYEKLNRRAVLRSLAASLPLACAAPSLFAADSPVRKHLGIGMHSYGFHWRAAKDNLPNAKFSDALTFLRYAKQLGASGVQVSLGKEDSAYAAKLRAEVENSGMYFEAQSTLPKQQTDLAQFEYDVWLARKAGVEVMRTALLSGRRYETFDSGEAFQKFREQSWQSLTLAEPILKRARLRLAVENHKDWLVPELLDWLRKISSEWIGVCVDFGNSIALLENAMEVVEAYAPFAASSHIKDMAVQEYADGFLLSEVPLGEGFLDLPRMVAVLLKANPKIQFNLEMITRDPLKIPCFTKKYWATMREAPAQRLASMLALVRQHTSKTALPHTTGVSAERQLALEDENVRKSLSYAESRLSL
ncbi:MAG TPA: TIM barrel protein [Methylomirabilota bacterium]|nr:TIM barrel protein [Methylomirabilota bacterium]